MLAHIAWLERWVWFVFCVQMLYDFWHDGIGLVYLEKILWLIHKCFPLITTYFHFHGSISSFKGYAFPFFPDFFLQYKF